MKRFLLCLLLLVAGAAPAMAQDFRGSKDHPAVTRYPGSVIKWYDVQQNSPYRIATGPVAGYRNIDRWVDTEGQLTRIYYELIGTRTHTEVYANYKKALTDAGFQIVSDGNFAQQSQADGIGSRKWMPLHYGANAFPPSAGIELLNGSATAGGTAFLAGKKESGGTILYVMIGMAQQRADRVSYVVDVLEAGAAETGLVQVSAQMMGEGIDRDGKIALYGLFFANDRADVLPTSKPALDEIAKLLKARPALKVYVVGHTDSNGTLNYNRTLAENRAKSVVKALVDTYGIAADRLDPQGVGPLVPVMANKSDGGRQRNRRVELVER